MQAQFTITPVRPDTTRAHPEVSSAFAYAVAGLAIVSIWVSVVLASVFAPDLVSGSQQEHLPLVGLTAWLWGAIATGIVVLTALEGSGPILWTPGVGRTRFGCCPGLARRASHQCPGAGVRDRH